MIQILICTNTSERLHELTGLAPSRVDLHTTFRSPVPVSDSDLAGFDIVLVVSDGSGTEGIDLIRLIGGRNDPPRVIIIAKTCDPAISYEALMIGGEYFVLPVSHGQFAPAFFHVVEKAAETIRAKRNLDFLHKKLNLVGSVTRHDVLNQLTAVGGYNELLAMMVEDPKLKGFIEKERSALEKIRRQFSYAKDYQNIGEEAPRWQEIRIIAGRMNELVDLGDVRVAIPPGGESILADPLFEKVLSNLFENAIRHGVRVTEIRVSIRVEPPGAILIVEDDGVGIPADEKMKIFERGYRYGFGLFLIQEILSITGMTIRENGTEGVGAWFTITVPEGMYRFGEGNPTA